MEIMIALIRYIPVITKSKRKILVVLINILFSFSISAQNNSNKINSGALSAETSENGLVSLQTLKNPKFNFPVNIFTSIEGCEVQGDVTTIRVSGNIIKYKKLLKNNSTGSSCYLTERFTQGKNSIHCDIQINGTGTPWTAKIQTNIVYKATKSSGIWAPWGDPRISKSSFPINGMLNVDKVTPEQNWTDPLLPRSFFNDTLFYGAPYFQYENPGIGFIPFQWNLLSIPMVSILESKEDAGMSIILNPGDDILDLTLTVHPDGTIIFNRLFNRISDKNILKFSFDIVCHEADWRGGLRWMSNNYPDYFNPSNPAADKMAGLGAYSDSDVDFDVSKMNKMDFRVNWRASFDFPYMGMFIPPVRPDESWTRFGGRSTSVDSMQQYAKKMKDLGFYTLSYFNVTEFGAKMKYPLAEPIIHNETDLWKSANDFLSIRLNGALLKVPERIPQEKLTFYSKTKSGGAYFTWEDGLIMDCGEPNYKNFLLDQAQRHIQLIPASDGICIDRLDWLRMYNEERDDGISWYIDRPARSLLYSWKNLMKDLCPLMHKNNKVIFVNNHDKRIDLLKNIDGIFDEFTYSGAPLNLTALLCINKPALGWTADNSSIKAEGADNFFQKYLYMGVYPMAPFPGNDHSIRPDEVTDRQYLDYGPLMAAISGKKWVLEPHAVEVVNNQAKANLFKIPDGYAAPVVFGKEIKTVILNIRNIPGLQKVICKAIYPGNDEYLELKSTFIAGMLQIQVPLVRGCAMVKIENVK
jgi:hypothetical protein